MKRFVAALSIAIIISTAFFARAEGTSDSFMRVGKSLEYTTVKLSDVAERSKVVDVIERVERDGVIFYEITRTGEGDYDKYTNISWKATSKLEEREGRLLAQGGVTTLWDKSNEIITKMETHFDYANKKIYYKASDRQGNVIQKKAFPLKGRTINGFTMVYFLKTYIANRGDKDYTDFYLISEEPKLYRITLKDIGRETLDLPTGKTDTLKFRLVVQVGLLTGLAKGMIPPTFVWYKDSSPYECLGYQGLESGLGTETIVMSLTDSQI